MQWGFFPILMGIIIVIVIAASLFGIWLCIWTYRDAEARGENGALWVIILLISGLIGLIIWLFVRGDKPVVNPRITATKFRSQSIATNAAPSGMKFCKNCGKPIPPNSAYCPHCGIKFN
jgi:hypothetical protein